MSMTKLTDLFKLPMMILDTDDWTQSVPVEPQMMIMKVDAVHS